MTRIPVVDVRGMAGPIDARRTVGREIDRACREVGFFAVAGHGIPAGELAALDRLARDFFSLDPEEKSEIAMARSGRAWRGWFPLGAELTSGAPDRKAGLYFGTELAPDDPRVLSGRLLHGPNLFPRRPAALGPAVLGWMARMRTLAATLLRGMALGLSLDEDWFARELTAEPTELFRIFHYPPTTDGWGVGEHTDYGLLTLLAQDECGGLQVRAPAGWIDVPGDPGLIVCNLGDMLDRMTAGRYRSTPHRVVNRSGRDRLSFPYFFDPGWEAAVHPLPGAEPDAEVEARGRWDGTSLRDLRGTYGEYLTAKVAKVFPDLAAEVGSPVLGGRQPDRQPGRQPGRDRHRRDQPDGADQ